MVVPLDRIFNVSRPQCSENLNFLFRELSRQRELFSFSLFISPSFHQTRPGKVEKVYVPPTPLIHRMFLKHAFKSIHILFTREIKNIRFFLLSNYRNQTRISNEDEKEERINRVS